MFYIGYTSDSFRRKFVVKAKAESRETADKINRELSDRLNKFDFNQDKRFGVKLCTSLRYKILSEKKYQEMLADRKKSSNEKRKKTLAKKVDKTKTYILCPRCHAHSKLLFSEMGGLQTRRCKNGHQFEHDKWIGDRLLSIAAFGNPVKAVEWALNNPIEVK
jgi:vacuolar-type H+-ATPase subunit H